MTPEEEQERAGMIESRVAKAIMTLTPWAKHLAARYDAPILLCGSILRSHTPRDCDVRIILRDEAFTHRYGQTAQEFTDDGPSQAWIDELAKFNSALVRRMRMSMDVQVYPESKWHPANWPVPIVLAAPSPKWWIHNAYHPKSKALLDMEAKAAANTNGDTPTE